MDYYKILNVSEDATLKEIEQAYKDLSSFYNPENNYSKTAYKKYREINKAYEVSKDLKQREIYNLSLSDGYKDYSESSNEELLSLDEFVKTKKEVNKDETIYSLKFIDVPYIYYLTKSYYEFDYDEYSGNEKEECAVCCGKGIVKTYGYTCKCDNCLGTGKHIVNKHIETRHTKVLVDSDKVIKGNLLFVFNFNDKDDYELHDNKIIWNRKNDSLELDLFDDHNSIHIDNAKQYNFKDYIIEVNNRVITNKKKGYIITNKKEVYLNKSDYTFTYNEDEEHSIKLTLDDTRIELDDLSIEVIKEDNQDNFNILFGKEIVRVNEKLFSVGGYINNKYVYHKSFYADDNYIYLPSKAYKSKLKDYLWFRIASLALLVLVPLLMFLIMGLTLAFLISAAIFLVVYAALINVMLEVKV